MRLATVNAKTQGVLSSDHAVSPSASSSSRQPGALFLLLISFNCVIYTGFLQHSHLLLLVAEPWGRPFNIAKACVSIFACF